jgi:hypothetical protein
MRIALKSMLLVAALGVILSISAEEPKAPGHRFIAGDDSKHHVAIVNAKGDIEWEYPAGPIHDLQVLPGGNFLFQTSYQHIVEVSPDKKVVWSYDASKMNGNEGKKVEVHAFQRLADGNTMIVESGPARILEVDKDGKIQKELKLVVKHPSTHSDTRNARKLENGHYLVAHENDGTVREYDEKGAVVWEYEVPLFDQKPAGGHGPEAFGNHIYSALRLPGGNTLIATGNGHSVIEVTPEKQIVWHLKQDELPGIKLAWVSTLQVLKNGNIVFGNCHAGPENPQIIEVTRDKKVVWSFKDFKNFGNSLPVSRLLDAE